MLLLLRGYLLYEHLVDIGVTCIAFDFFEGENYMLMCYEVRVECR